MSRNRPIALFCPSSVVGFFTYINKYRKFYSTEPLAYLLACLLAFLLTNELYGLCALLDNLKAIFEVKKIIFILLSSKAQLMFTTDR